MSLAKNRDYQITGTYRNSQKKYSEISEWLELDLSSEASIENFFQNLENRNFDLVIYLVGATKLIEIEPRAYVEINFLNPIRLFEMLTEKFAKETPSCFVFISSRAAKYPSFDTYYSAVKSGLSAALRSLSSTAHSDSKFLSLLPGLIVGSQMYKNMIPSVRESHRARSSNKLLNVSEAAGEIFTVIDNKDMYANGDQVEIGPSYP